MRVIIKLAVVFFVLPVVVWAGPLFDSGADVREVSTRYFRILYSTENERTAQRLVSMVDGIYEEWATRLRLSERRRFLVVVTPDIEMFNGMFTPLPRNTILMYDYMSDPLLIPSDDSLKLLFTHELLHAISFNIRTPLWDGLSFVVGDVATPQYFQQPWWMIEGIATGGESLTGHGRVNSPAWRAMLSRHFVEGRFEDYSDVAQLRFTRGHYHYIYGGFFIDYLQRKYGWEKVADLWKKSAEAFWPYSFESTFKRVYGVPIAQKWRSFASNFHVVETSFPSPQRVLQRGKSSSLRLADGGVYLMDDEMNMVYRVVDGRIVRLGEGTGVAVWGDTVALRQARREQGKPRDGFVVRRSKERPLFLSRVIDMDIRGERFFMVQADGLLTRLVFQEGGRREELLPASVGIKHALPRFVSDDVAVFVMLVTNRPFLGVWNRVEGSFRFFDFSAYEITSLSIAGDEAWMTVFPREGNSLGRVGVFSFSDETLWVQTNDVRGGLHAMVPLRDELYVVRRYKEYDRVEVFVVGDFPREQMGEIQSPQQVALDTRVRDSQTNVVLDSRPARRFSDFLPGVRLPYVFPDPFVLGVLGEFFWHAGLYLYNEDPLRENVIETHFHGFGGAFSMNALWRNRYWYPFSTVVGGGMSFSDFGAPVGNVYGGFSYKWNISSSFAFRWDNRVSFSGVGNRWNWQYSSFLNSAQRLGNQPRPYPFPGPVLLQAYVDERRNYFFYGSLNYNLDMASFSLLGGWGNTAFFSPLSVMGNYVLLSQDLLLTNQQPVGMGMYRGVVGGRGMVYFPLIIEAGYRHLPVYVKTAGVVLGSYALLMQSRRGWRDFYAGYAQVYVTVILGYVVPVSLLAELNYNTDGLYFSTGFSLNF